MSDNVISFTDRRRQAEDEANDGDEPRRYGHLRRRGRGPNMQTCCFRSYKLIVEADDAALMHDVIFDIDKARTKLRLVQRRLQSVQQQAAAQVEMLTTAETKLTAAIVAALLQQRGQR